MQQAAIDSSKQFPKASGVILKDFYVDDLVTGEVTLTDLQRLKAEITCILNSVGFNLIQWKSNNVKFLGADQAQENIRFADDEAVKTLGNLWKPNSDTFQFEDNINLSVETLNKRIVLSIIGKIFDPLGIIGPVVVKAKIIL